jgi:hypothetical protein
VTLVLDLSALVTRYRHEPGTDLVADAMDRDPRWAEATAARSLGMVVVGIDTEPDDLG